MTQLTAAQSLRRMPIPRPAPRAATAPVEVAEPTIAQFMKSMHVSQWLLVLYPIILLLLHRRRDEGDVAVVDSSALAQIAITALFGTWVLGRLVQSLKTIEKTLVGTPLRWLLLYVIFAVLSAAWSTMQSLTAFRSLQVLVFLLLVADAMYLAKTAQNMLRTQLLFAMSQIFCWQLVPALQNVSLEGLHSSDVPGTVVAIAFMGWMIRGKQWRMLYLAVIACALVATSAGTFIACLAGLIVSLIFMRGRASGIGLILLFGMFITFTCFSQEVNRVVFWGKNESTIKSGSGRIPIWQWILFERMPESPIVGFGFGAGEVQARLFNQGGFRMMHMHNATMSAIANLGAVGVALYALLLMALYRKAFNQPDHKIRVVLLGAMTAVVCNTMTMESVTAPLSPAFIAHSMFYATVAIGAWGQSELRRLPMRRVMRPRRVPLRVGPEYSMS
jgi:hypothetical protein